MSNDHACPACCALVPREAQHCPDCGAQIYSTMRWAKKGILPRVSLVGITMLAVLAFVFFAVMTSRHEEAAAAGAKGAFTSDVRSGRLNNREAFEARCTKAQSARETAAGTELRYASASLYVTLRRSESPIFETSYVRPAEDGTLESYRAPASPELVFELLGCN